jgi:indolepyruvate ferredoxin oxidoreductase
LSDAGRVPYFCSGCPHNSSTRVPEGSEAIAGVGCHFMATYIFSGTRIFSPMGSEGAAWVGHAPFTDTKHIFANMGDGTYYHSGLLAIRAAVTANIGITFKILYNDATAATGGQPLPGPLNVPALTRQLEAEGVARIVVVTDQPEKYGKRAPFASGVTVRHRDHLDAVQRELREVAGVTALVYDQTCAAEKRRRRKRGKFPDPARRSFINTRVCEGCGDCSTKSNCVSVTPVETEFGRKRAIDQSSCNKDFSCQNGFCPSFVNVEGGRPRRGKAMAADDQFAQLPEAELPALARPYSIVVAGVGGTGIITVGALLGMAAHLEGKGVSVLDMTGVAQKGGAVTTFVKIAARPADLTTIRIAAGEANAVIGSDLLVTAENSIMTRMQRGVTKAVINTNRLATVAFIKNPDLQTPWVAMEDGVRDVIGADAARFLDATRIATALLGDSLATNIFLLGYAYQMGLVPVSRQAIFRAVELNGATVDANQRAFNWGRLAYHDPASVERQARPTETEVGSDRVIAPDLDAAVARRVDFLTAYQDTGLAQRYQSLVDRVRRTELRVAGDSILLTEAVARNYFKLLAIKDEYEVARLYTDGEFQRQVDAAFEGDYKLRYHFAPPLWVKPDKVTGAPVKRTYGAWMRPVLKMLAKLKGLRGTWLDPFGHTEERQLERRLITDYERTVEELERGLRVDNLDLAVEVATLPATIRGYGHVKRKNIGAAKTREAALLGQFRKPRVQPVPLAA